MTWESWIPTAQPGPAAAPDSDRPLNWFGNDDALRQRRVPFSASEPKHLLAAVLVGLVVLLVSANVVDQVLLALSGGAQDVSFGSASDLVYNLLVNLVFFSLPPLVWVVALHGGVPGLRLRMGLRGDRLGPDLLWGIGIALGTVVATIALLISLEALGVSTENPAVEELSRNIPWAVVPLLAISAGVGEELFFRGLLQPRVGIVPTNLFFGLVHMSYGTPLQVIVPLLLGFVYSWSFVRTRSLVPAILAHTLFDLFMLTLAKLGST